MLMLEAEDLHERVRDGFLTAFGTRPAVVGRAPGRVNVVGEHTDYLGGSCLPIALEHSTWAAVGQRRDDLVRVSSATTGQRWTGRLDDRPPGGAAYVVGALRALGHPGGLDVHVESAVPLGAGLSSSAALICAVAVAVSRAPAEDLLTACVRAEAVEVGAPTGGMDQTIALLASPGHALLLDFSGGNHQPVPWRPEAAGLELLVVDTMTRHSHADGAYGVRRAEGERAMARPPEELDATLVRRRRHVTTENQRVTDVVAALRKEDWERVGELLTSSHASLRDDYEVSCDELDAVVSASLGAGALGARMTGGGFGGCAVVLADAGDRSTVLGAVAEAFRAAGRAEPRALVARAGGPAGREALTQAPPAREAPPRP